MSVVVMTVGVMSVGEITVGVMTVGVMRRPRNTNIYRNSFFVRTVHDWNQLDNSTVSVTSVEAFRACLSRD